jgi:hypothetical protein
MIDQVAAIVVLIESVIVPNWPVFLLLSILFLFSIQFIYRMPKDREMWITLVRQNASRILLGSLPIGIVFGAVFANLSGEDRLAHVTIFLGNVVFWPLLLYVGYAVSIVMQKSYLDRIKRK